MGRGSENTQIGRLTATAFLSIATLALVIWSGLSAGGSQVQQLAEPIEPPATLDEEQSDECYSRAVRDNLRGDPEYVLLTLEDYRRNPEHCRTREEEVQQALQALGTRRPQRPAPVALADGTLEESDGTTYDPKIHRWDRLPPAVTPRSSDDCVGYCFNAIIASVSKKNRRVARVVVFEKDGTPARAIVHRTRIENGSRMAAREGKPLRFACFDRFEAPGEPPRFEQCVQTETARRRRPKPEVRDDPFENPLGDLPIDF